MRFRITSIINSLPLHNHVELRFTDECVLIVRCRRTLRKFNYSAEIRRHMIFGNDKIKLLIFILLISVIIFAATILAKVNVWITIAVGVFMFVVILLIALYGYEDEK